MNAEDPAVRQILSRAMVARIATLSRSGRPSVNPLYFILAGGKIWLGTPEWTLAARNVSADPRVSLLFNVERDAGDRRVLRITGRATVRVDARVNRAYGLAVVRKYILTPGGVLNWLAHPRQLWRRRYYTAQSHAKGRTGVIEVTPEHFELLENNW